LVILYDLFAKILCYFRLDTLVIMMFAKLVAVI